MTLKWVSNTYDPDRPDASHLIVPNPDETMTTAWQHHLEWLKDKTIGRPQPTKYFTEDELVSMHMVGVYVEEVTEQTEDV